MRDKEALFAHDYREGETKTRKSTMLVLEAKLAKQTRQGTT